MKKLLVILAAAIILAGCASGNDEPPDPALLASAETVGELLPYIDTKRTKDQPLYSDCGKKNDLLPYFELLNDHRSSYIVTEYKGEKYVLFYYTYTSRSSVLLSIDEVKNTYDGNDLHIECEYTIMAGVTNGGCFSNGVSVSRCIVRLDRDIERLFVEKDEYRPYAGGLVTAGGKKGVADEDLVMTAPCEIDDLSLLYTKTDIFRTDAFGKKGEMPKGTLYLVTVGERCGVMDKDLDFVVEPRYSRVDYDSEDRFIAYDCEENGAAEERTYILDGKGEVVRTVKGCLGKWNSILDNHRDRLLLCERSKEPCKKGVIDGDMNEIIPVKYANITGRVHNYGDICFICTDDEKRSAVFDCDGVQLTEFKTADPLTLWSEFTRNKNE